MNYQVKPLGRECAGTGEPLVPGSTVHSALLKEGDEWVRLDFSTDGWTGAPEGTIGYWTGVVPVPEAKPRRLDPDDLLLLLERLDEKADPRDEPLRYVIALLLVRKRRLELEESHTDEAGDVIQTFAGTRGEARFEIRDPDLGEAGIERLQHELQARVDAGLVDWD